MLTLEQITENTKIVIDTSFLRRRNNNSIFKSEIKSIIDFLENCGEKVIIVPGVIKENEINSRNTKRGIGYLKKRVNNGAGIKVKRAHHEIDSKSYFLGRILKRLRKQEVDFSEIPFYQSLFRSLCYLADTLKIKDPEKRTDESIVATAFFLAYCGSEKVAILSNDSDMLSLSCALIRESKGYVESMIRGKQIRVYGNHNGTGDLTTCEVRWDSTIYPSGRPRLSYKKQRELQYILESAPITA